MKRLELKVPPPVVALLVAGAMWVAGRFAPYLAMPRSIAFLAAVALGLAGIGAAAAGVMAFRRARTTVNPTRPQETSALVSTGIYGLSRNPMYAGLLLILAGWAVYLSSPWPLAGPIGFVLYMNRFQIAPEERALSQKFGEVYADYKSKVRRWL